MLVETLKQRIVLHGHHRMSSRTSLPVDKAFTKALPKVELHAHLSGSISRECLREIWLHKKSKDPSLQVPDPFLSMPPGKVDYSLKSFFTVFSDLIYRLCTDQESLRYATRRALQDFKDDGVRYLELRTTPRQSAQHSISKDTYVSTVLDVIDEFSNDDMTTKLILSVDRSKPAAAADELVELAIKYQNRGVVGVELGGNPMKGDVSIFQSAFTKAKNNGLRLTLHFAETIFSASPQELYTLLAFNPDRLGHVIHVPEDVKDEIARRKLGLELCLSCNVHAKLIEGGFPDHHFGYWRHRDCPVVLGTDDVGFFCSPLSNEYLLAAQHFDLDRPTIVGLCKRSVGAIFGGTQEKERLYQLIDNFEKQML